MKKFYWPIHKFWTYSPMGYALAVVWNCFELVGKPMPRRAWAFGVIMGAKGVKVK